MSKTFILITTFMWGALSFAGASSLGKDKVPPIYIGITNNADSKIVFPNKESAMNEDQQSEDYELSHKFQKIEGFDLPDTDYVGGSLYDLGVICQTPQLFLHPQHQYILCLSPLTERSWVIDVAEKKAYKIENDDRYADIENDNMFGDIEKDKRDAVIHPVITVLDMPEGDSLYKYIMGNCGHNGYHKVCFLNDGFIIDYDMQCSMISYKGRYMAEFDLSFIEIHTPEGKWICWWPWSRSEGIPLISDMIGRVILPMYNERMFKSADNYYISDLVNYETKYNEVAEYLNSDSALFIQTPYGIKRMGEPKEFFLLDNEWSNYYDQFLKPESKKGNTYTFYKSMCNWFSTREDCYTPKITYATHFPSHDNGEKLFFFYWVAPINGTDYKRILYAYCDRKGNIIKTAEFYPAEYNEMSGQPLTSAFLHCPVFRADEWPYFSDLPPQKIGNNAVALLVYRSTGKYVYYIVSPYSERIIEIRANTALYFLPTLLDGGKTLFAVSQDEWKGYDAPLPVLPYLDMLNWERNHNVTTGSYGYFIPLPLNIENQ